LEVELVKTEANSAAAFNQSAEYLKLSPLGKIPAFEGANGFTLSESIAIAVYGMFQFALMYLFSTTSYVEFLYMMSNFYY
jgi:hypothetical protein